MPVPSSISDLSTTPALNSPPGSESPSLIDDYLRTLSAFIRQINDSAATKADDSAVVKLTGAQTVAGTKTFSASPVVPDATAPKHPVTKDQLDAQLDAKAPIASPAFTGVPTAPNPTAGTRSQALATMQMFADEFVASLAANGYQKLPSGLIIQWGSANYAAGVGAVVYPIAFPTATRSIQLTLQSSGAGSYSNDATGNISTTGFTAYQNSPVNSSFFWIAIGY